MSPKIRPSPALTPTTAVVFVRVAQRLGDADRDRRVVVLCCHGIVGDPDLVHRIEERRTNALGKHRDECHEREADHERRGRGSRALRVSHGVVAGEDAGGATEPRCGPAEEMGERHDELGREERDAEEDQQGAEPHQREDLSRREAAPEQAVREQRESEQPERRRADRAVAGEASRRQRGAFPDGGDRRNAGCAPSRPQACDDRDEDADEERHDDRPRLEQQAAVGKREAGLLEEPEEPLREGEAEQRGRARDARKPRTSDSNKTDRLIWRREAPIVRSVANSRVRWATVIDSEFAITNAPTNSAIPPNASRNPCRKLMKPWVSLASSSAWPSPVRTCAVGGRMSRIEATSSGLGRARRRRRPDLVEPANLVEQALGRR